MYKRQPSPIDTPGKARSRHITVFQVHKIAASNHAFEEVLRFFIVSANCGNNWFLLKPMSCQSPSIKHFSLLRQYVLSYIIDGVLLFLLGPLKILCVIKIMISGIIKTVNFYKQ